MRKTTKAVMGLALALILAGCSNSSNVLEPASPIAGREEQLYRIVFYMALGVFLIVEVLLIYNIIRFRRRVHDYAVPDQHYRHLVIEAIWTGIPMILVAILFALTISTMNAVAAPKPQASDINVTVVGHRWWWEFDYPDLGIKTANELHIPINTSVQISLESVDVVHSFWVPELAGKTDVIPGITNHMWLKGDKVGEYYGQCAEYCGLNHANMRLRVFVDSQDDYNAWVANQQQPPTAPQTAQQQQGYNIVVNGVCSNCHTLGSNQGASPIGPNLTHLYSRTTFAGASFDLNETNLRSWLQDTQAMKPGNDMKHINLTSDQIDALLAYLTTLK